jgi:XTP/dITP diphosphohydrolase
MSMPSPLPTLVLATRNQHKLGEIRAILGEGFRYMTLHDLAGAPTVAEDAATFAGNSAKKAVQLARWLAATQNSKLKTQNCFVLADDSGLEVDALNGAPGVHSARFAALDMGAESAPAGNSLDLDNNAKLLRLLKDLPPEKRTARFLCVLALTPILATSRQNASPVCYADEFEMQTELFEGACGGRIGFAPRGRGGFGYDPLFIPNNFEQTFGELGEEVKNRLSHRAKALAKLKGWLDSRFAVST